MKRPFFDPGRLNHRMQLERIVETPDGCGGTAISWVPLATVWAAVSPRRTVQTTEAQQRIERVLHDITVRFRADLGSDCRLRMGSRTFEIDTVHDPDESRRYLVCTTREEGR